MNEREIKGIGIVVGVGLLGMAVLNGVYRSGVEAGLARSGNCLLYTSPSPRDS